MVGWASGWTPIHGRSILGAQSWKGSLVDHGPWRACSLHFLVVVLLEIIQKSWQVKRSDYINTIDNSCCPRRFLCLTVRSRPLPTPPTPQIPCAEGLSSFLRPRNIFLTCGIKKIDSMSTRRLPRLISKKRRITWTRVTAILVMRTLRQGRRRNHFNHFHCSPSTYFVNVFEFDAKKLMTTDALKLCFIFKLEC